MENEQHERYEYARKRINQKKRLYFNFHKKKGRGGAQGFGGFQSYEMNDFGKGKQANFNHLQKGTIQVINEVQ